MHHWWAALCSGRAEADMGWRAGGTGTDTNHQTRSRHRPGGQHIMIRPASMRAIARRKTAYHEAGHAVLGRILTLVCDSATIKPDHDSAGTSLTHDPWDC